MPDKDLLNLLLETMRSNYEDLRKDSKLNYEELKSDVKENSIITKETLKQATKTNGKVAEQERRIQILEGIVNNQQDNPVVKHADKVEIRPNFNSVLLSEAGQKVLFAISIIIGAVGLILAAFGKN